MSKTVIRLYDQFQPSHYILNLDPDRDKMTFKGSVIISGRKVKKPSKRLTIHQHGLKISHAHLVHHDKKGDREIKISRINHHDKFDEVRFHADEVIYPGNYTLSCEFSGKISRPMNGIYPCFFKYDKQDKQLIATQFESHHAREAFPCIDEPEAKATFDLTLTTPVDETVLANTPVKEQRTDNKKQITTFETTPKMSTYLLAFVYGDLKYLESKTKDGVVVRTYATPDQVKFTDFALDVAVKCLEFFNDYFAIDYPLEKCDFVALPDFASGAMENWGLITFREHTLLVDPANTSLPSKQYVAMVVAHELAHQWFGNLVTMRWWTDLWLNEGFATWISYLATDHMFPEWDVWTQYIVDEQQIAFRLDALEHTHPIEVPVNHPDEIRSIFDAISYEKGSSAIHMLHQYLGATTFRDGLRYYLKKHAYGNTDTVDLWHALEEISHKPIKEFMRVWTTLPGYPILLTDVEGGDVAIKQERFYLNPKLAKEPAQSPIWPVPLLAPLTGLKQLFDTRDDKYENIKTGSLKLNSSQSGFYRVHYNATHMEQLADLIKRGKVEPLDRLGLLSDTFETAKAGYGDTVDALHFLETYHNEDNAAVWDIIAASLASLRTVMDDEDLREAMKPYIRDLVADQLRRLGWTAKSKEPHFDQLLRPTILAMASLAEEPTVVKEALKRFKTLKKPEDLEPDLRAVVYGTAVRHGRHEEFNKLLKMHNVSTSGEERITIASALTGFKQPELISKALGLIKSDDVRLQDVSYWVAYSFMNRYAKQATWQWLTKEWKWLEKNLSSDLSFFRFPIFTARAYSDRAFLPDYKQFFNSVRTPALDRSIKQGVEIIEWQSAWKTRDGKEVLNFFKTRANS